MSVRRGGFATLEILFFILFLVLELYEITYRPSVATLISLNELIGRARSWEQVAQSVTLTQFLLGPSSRG